MTAPATQIERYIAVAQRMLNGDVLWMRYDKPLDEVRAYFAAQQKYYPHAAYEFYEATQTTTFEPLPEPLPRVVERLCQPCADASRLEQVGPAAILPRTCERCGSVALLTRVKR